MAGFASLGDRTYSFRDLDRASRAAAAEFAAKGLVPGDRVAIMMANRPEVLFLLYGLARAGLVWVPINPQQRGVGLRYLIEHSQPNLVIADDSRLQSLQECRPQFSGFEVIAHGPTTPSFLDHLLDEDIPWQDVPATTDSLFAIMYTSGTTGHPKGVLVTHGMMRFAAEAAILLADARDGDRLLMWEPLYHVGGAQVLLMPLLRRLTIAMVERFSASRFWQEVRETGSTHIHYLGGILQMLQQRPASASEREHGVRVGWGAGARADNWNAIQDRFGISLREAYGMTETSSIATYNGDGTPGSVGRTVPWFSVQILDDAGRPVPPDSRGEIVLTPLAPHALFAGYYRNEDATKAALRDGKMYTNDVGSMDQDGRLYFHGRKTDSIRCRGENVSAMEIEQVVAMHPAVVDAAALGVDAQIGEQEIKLFVQLKQGVDLSAASLSEWLSDRLAAYQNPRYIAFVKEFERTPSERIMKHRLERGVSDSWDRLPPTKAPTSNDSKMLETPR
ncbi:AMP-binding protein [Bosea sp. 2KB_26]|uniref:AMP-binding protein n=1 Tax=Bosea sp. 2KB_26 TaxID=3237475 RepID=UPI003F8DB9AA